MEEELLPSAFILTQDFSDGTEFLLCLSDTAVLLTCANTESVMYLKKLPELPKLLYIYVEIKYSTAGSSHSIKVPSEAEMVLKQKTLCFASALFMIRHFSTAEKKFSPHPHPKKKEKRTKILVKMCRVFFVGVWVRGL